MTWTTKTSLFLHVSLQFKNIHKIWGDQNKDGNSKTILQFKETGIGDTVTPSSE